MPGQASAQWGYTSIPGPPEPCIHLDSESFAETVRDETTLVIGRLTTLVFLETRSEAHGLGGLVPLRDWDFYHVKIQIEKQYFGPDMPTEEISVHDVRLEPIYPPGVFGWRPQRKFQVDDLVLMRVRVLEDGSYDPLRMCHVEPDEIARLERVVQMLAIDRREEQAEQVFTGCFDRDPYYALWCLDVAQDDRWCHTFDLSTQLYADLRRHLSAKQFDYVLWTLFTEPATHPLVWMQADRFLRSSKFEQLSDDSREAKKLRDFRYQKHVERIPLLIPAEASEVHAIYQDRALSYLFDEYAHERTKTQWAEMVERLDQCFVEAPQHPSIPTMLLAMRGIFNPNHKPLRDNVFAFFKRHAQRAGRGTDASRAPYGSGLVPVMVTDSDHSKSLCREGLDVLMSDLVTADKQHGKQIVGWLERYANHCRSEEIEWQQLSAILRELAAVVPDLNNRNEINAMLLRLKIELPDRAKPAS